MNASMSMLLVSWWASIQVPSWTLKVWWAA
jgi:hypothetical protein